MVFYNYEYKILSDEQIEKIHNSNDEFFADFCKNIDLFNEIFPNLINVSISERYKELLSKIIEKSKSDISDCRSRLHNLTCNFNNCVSFPNNNNQPNYLKLLDEKKKEFRDKCTNFDHNPYYPLNSIMQNIHSLEQHKVCKKYENFVNTISTIYKCILFNDNDETRKVCEEILYLFPKEENLLFSKISSEINDIVKKNIGQHKMNIISGSHISDNMNDLNDIKNKLENAHIFVYGNLEKKIHAMIFRKLNEFGYIHA